MNLLKIWEHDEKMGPFNLPRKMSHKARMWKENRRAAKPVKLPPTADRRFPSTRAGRGRRTGRHTERLRRARREEEIEEKFREAKKKKG